MSKRVASTAAVARAARKLHRDAVIIDAHNDHFTLKAERGKPLDFMKVNRRYHSDGPRLMEAGVTASLFYVGGNDLPYSLMLIERALQEIEDHSGKLMLVKSVADIRRAHRLGKLGVMMIWEGATGLSDRIETVGLLHRLGVRAIGLTHGQGGVPFALQGTRSYFGYCSAADRASFRRICTGLTGFGREVVRTMNRLGMLVDLAHSNDATFYQVMDLSTRPVACTHGGVFACCPHARCLTDDQIKALAQKQGVLGIAFYHKFVARQAPTVERIVDQIAYVGDLVGIEHVGIGSDFDGLPEGIWPVIRQADRLVCLTETMLRRGFHDAEIRKVLGGNFMRVLKAGVG